MERRLAAILSADVVGYSRLMGEDEAATLEALKADRAELFDPRARQYNGRTIKLMGDGALMEFPSVVEAVGFAVECQLALKARNAARADGRPILYRIGINIGDIIVEDGDIFGDGVNVAARVEALAAPGGICVSQNVRDQVRDKLDIDFEEMGEVEVKNIARPIRPYHVVLDEKAAALATAVAPIPAAMARRWPRMAAVLVLLAALAGGGAWWVSLPDIEPANPVKYAFKLPDKPSIAVLPFDNLSDDPSQDIFGDGMTQDIITDLSKFRDLMVISANSTFTYKNKPTKVQQVAEELGVRYVLEGSIQRKGDDVRINAQFIDAITGEHVWAERYDRKMTDFFAVQDEISTSIVSLLGAHEGIVAEADRTRAKGKESTDLSAYELAILAREIRNRFNKEDNKKALEMLERARTLDPNSVRTQVGLAWTHYQDAVNGWVEDRELSAKLALESAETAIALDPAFGEGHFVLGSIHLFLLGQIETGIAEFERAIEINPNHADTLALWGGWVLPSLGRAEEGIETIKEAMRSNPFHDDWYDQGLHAAYFAAERYDEAVSTYREIKYPLVNTQLVQISSLAHAGELEMAYVEAKRFLERRPEFSVSEYSRDPSFNFHTADHNARLFEGLRKAGLPETPPTP